MLALTGSATYDAESSSDFYDWLLFSHLITVTPGSGVDLSPKKDSKIIEAKQGPYLGISEDKAHSDVRAESEGR